MHYGNLHEMWFVLCPFTIVITFGFALRETVVIPSVMLSDSYGASSLGDQLLVLGVIAALKCSGRFDKIHLNLHPSRVSEAQTKLELEIESIFSRISCDNSSMVKTSISFSHRKIEVENFEVFDEVSESQFIAADCLDGYYNCQKSILLWKRIAASSRVQRVNVLSASFDRSKAMNCPDLISYLRENMSQFYSKNLSIFARDSPSFRDLRSMLHSTDPLQSNHNIMITMSPDVSFNMPLVSKGYGDDDGIRRLLKIIKSDRKAGRSIIAVNLNIHPSSKVNQTTLMTTFVKAICICAKEEKITVTYVPHEYRINQDDRLISAAYTRLTESICPEMSSYTHTPKPTDRIHDAMAMKHLLSKAKLVFSSRMHAALSALERGVSVAVIGAHQNKFHFVHDFDLGMDQSCLLSMHSGALTNALEMATFLRLRLARAREERDGLGPKVARVKKLAAGFAYT